MGRGRLGVGEVVAGVGGLALLLSTFLPWYGSDALDGADIAVATELDAWQSFALLDVVLVVVAIVAVGFAIVSLAETAPELPRPPGRIAMGAGALALVAILMRLIVAPEADLGLGIEAELTPRIGSFAGLVSAAAITWGGWRATAADGAGSEPAATG